jgi:acetyltransferase-like isoleucine patch superfamily enzyme
VNVPIIVARNRSIGNNTVFGEGVIINAPEVSIGDNVEVQDNVHITCLEKFSIGEESVIGKNAQWSAKSIEIGRMFYSDENPTPMVIGGGGWKNGVVKMGDGVVIHDSFINCAANVTLGSNVGLSPGSSILTHGFWNPIIDGYWRRFGPVSIGHNSFLGYKAMVLPGVMIGNYSTVGAGAVVTKDVPDYTIVAGNPAKVIGREPEKFPVGVKMELVEQIVKEYRLLRENKVGGERFAVLYDSLPRPRIELVREGSSDSFMIYLDDYSWEGIEDEASDDLRDFLRHYGIRILSRKFKSLPYRNL